MFINTGSKYTINNDSNHIKKELTENLKYVFLLIYPYQVNVGPTVSINFVIMVNSGCLFLKEKKDFYFLA